MPRLTLIHWNRAEAAERAAHLKRAGYEVAVLSVASRESLKAEAENPPDAFVVDLSRSPSQGRDVALWLRSRKGGRGASIAFMGGEPEMIDRIRRDLPDAACLTWRRWRRGLRQAIANRPAAAKPASVLAGYSGTPLPRKLGLKAGCSAILLDAPDGFEEILGALPDGVGLRRGARGASAHRVLLFVRSKQNLRRRLVVAKRAMAEGGGLWIVWPKKTSPLAGDLTQQFVRATGLADGLVDYKICAVDEDWSGLCFARRRQQRREPEGEISSR